MALTAFQRSICRLLAPSRKIRESYVAGGVALNKLLAAPRRSRDLDLFHDRAEAVASTVLHDSQVLERAGYRYEVLRESPTFTEAMLSLGADSTLIQWVQDSAFRFYPLLTDDELGLTLHPFDLATNKVLAMAGRLEARDWMDVLTCHERLQPLGYLAWAACGKDPGYGPPSLLQAIRRASRYSQAELDVLDYEGPVPDAQLLGQRWHAMLQEAETLCDLLPAEEAGACVVTAENELCRMEPEGLRVALGRGHIRFHQGRIGGAWPAFPKTSASGVD